MNPAITFALITMVFWGVGDFLIQKSIRKFGHIESLFLITLVSSIFLVPFVLPSIIQLDLSQWLILLLLGIIVFLGSNVHFIALKKGKLAIVETIIGLELPLTILLGIIFLKESATLLFIVLAIVFFLGSLFVSIDFHNLKFKNYFEKGAILAFWSAVIMALINFFTAVSLKSLDPLQVIAFSWLVTCIITLFILLKKRRVGPLLKQVIPEWKLIVPMVILDISAWLCYAWALSLNHLSTTTSITESYVIIAFILGIFLNKEKISLWQIIGAILSLGTSLAIAFFV